MMLPALFKITRFLEHRRVMLNGLMPEVIMDIAARGVGFYDLQMNFELVGNMLKLKEKIV